MRLIVPLLMLSCALLTPSAALAWNYTGHRTIATIAYDELKPEVRRKVDAILKAHPRYDRDLLGEMPAGYPDPHRFAFAMSAFWPDIIRNQLNPMHFTHHKPMWHYIDVRLQLPDWRPSTAPATTPTTAATQPVEGPKNIIEAIAKNRAGLRDASMGDAQKAVAVCWLAHLVGDLHQPLHATTLYSAQFPDGDKGGNSFIVSRGREQENLHATWDEMLGLQTSPQMIDYLAGAIRSDPRLQRDALATEVAQRDPEAWKRESHEIGRTFAYRDGTLQGASSEDVRRDPMTVVPPLPPGYVRDAEPIAARRAALAGYRLAELLNAALGE